MTGAVSLKGFPNLRQTHSYDCGAQVLQSILSYYGTEVREDEIIRVTQTTVDGTSPDNLVSAIAHYGLKYETREMTIKEIKAFIDEKILVILVLQAWSENSDVDWENDWDDGHYVAAIGYDNEKIIFEDPSAFHRTYLSYQELEERWHDKGIDGKEYYHLGIAVYGKDPSPSRDELIHMG